MPMNQIHPRPPAPRPHPTRPQDPRHPPSGPGGIHGGGDSVRQAAARRQIHSPTLMKARTAYPAWVLIYMFLLCTATATAQDTPTTRMDDPISFESQQVYTSPTVMNVKAGAKINLEPGAEMVIDRRSTLILENASQLDIQAGAVLRVKREGALKLLDGATINVEDGGEIIIEERDGIYLRGKMIFDENARINLNGSGSILDVGGLVHIGDGAVFRLSTSTTAFKTNGKIILRGTADVEFTAGNDASIFIRGFQKSQEVIVNQKVAMEFPPNLTDFVIQDLRISQLYARRIIPPRSNDCNILFKNVMVNNSFGEYDHYGVWTYGQAQLTFVNCDFNSGARGIVANNLEWGYNLK